MTGAANGPDRWQRLEELFHAAIEIPPHQRDAFLRQSCDGDDPLREEIETLLANDFAESHLEGIVDSATTNLFEEDD